MVSFVKLSLFRESYLGFGCAVHFTPASRSTPVLHSSAVIACKFLLKHLLHELLDRPSARSCGTYRISGTLCLSPHPKQPHGNGAGNRALCTDTYITAGERALSETSPVIDMDVTPSAYNPLFCPRERRLRRRSERPQESRPSRRRASSPP